jgi:hypothetical protein
VGLIRPNLYVPAAGVMSNIFQPRSLTHRGSNCFLPPLNLVIKPIFYIFNPKFLSGIEMENFSNFFNFQNTTQKVFHGIRKYNLS